MSLELATKPRIIAAATQTPVAALVNCRNWTAVICERYERPERPGVLLRVEQFGSRLQTPSPL